MSNAERQQKIHLISLGCPKNTVDSERMLGLLQGNGYAITLDPAEADVVILGAGSLEICLTLSIRSENTHSIRSSLDILPGSDSLKHHNFGLACLMWTLFVSLSISIYEHWGMTLVPR